ncbi:MAG: IPT/TIG domain-containing protein, partial [Candidatus Sericytochromatia bacterium]
LTVASCQAPPAAAPVGSSVAAVPALSVRVAFPAPAAPYRVAATASELLDRATVSLMSLDGRTLASGVTDASGAASLQPGADFVTASGTAHVLEAVKGLGAGAPGSRALRLRTLVVFEGGAWKSLSGDAADRPVAIDTLTTAVALQSVLTPGAPSAAAALGKVDASVSPARLVGSPAFSTGTDAAILALQTMIGDYLAAGRDAVAEAGVAPTVSSLSAGSGAPGDVIVVEGAGFSSLPGGNTVRIGAVEAMILAASATRLVVAVPPGAGAEGLVVQTAGGTSEAAAFAVSAGAGPTIASLSSTELAPGASLTISGTGFHPTPLKNVVTINGAEATVTGGTATRLTVTVPTGAHEGPGGVVVMAPGATSPAAAVTIARSLSLIGKPIDPESTGQYLASYGVTLWPASFRAPGPGSPGLPSNWDAGDGSDGPFHPTTHTVLDSNRTYQFSSIHVPLGVGVTGSEFRLSIKCRGAVRIEGAIDVSGQRSQGAHPGGASFQDGLGLAPGLYVYRSTDQAHGRYYGAYGTPDLEQDPLPVGSSGAGGFKYANEPGGGAAGSIRLSALGGLVLAGGGIYANGGDYYSTAGAGSGGSIFLKTSRLVSSDSYAIQAFGGDAGGAPAPGGDGRVRIDTAIEAGTDIVGLAESVPYRGDPGVTFETAPQTLRSAAIDLGGAGHDRVHYLGSTAALETPAGTTARVSFSDSADGLTWGPWTTDVRQLGRRYVRYQAELQTTDPTRAPVLRSLTLRYQL